MRPAASNTIFSHDGRPCGDRLATGTVPCWYPAAADGGPGRAPLGLGGTAGCVPLGLDGRTEDLSGVES